MFCIKDQDLFGISNKYISECFVTFEEIASTGRLDQMHLKLSRPTVTGLFASVPFENQKKFRIEKLILIV